MATLVSLEVQQPSWESAAEQVFIGKDILELLSTSMYIEPLSMYREYVQNAADSLDFGTANSTATSMPFDIEIHIDRQQRTIRITDGGPGLSKSDFYKRLTSIGGSTKRGTNARGFRGVGRLAGLAFCQELIFRSRAAGSNQVEELRWDTRKVRSLLRATDSNIDLTNIVSESIQRRSVPAFGVPAHFFEVELRNVVRHRDDRLLNPGEIANYLGQVAPVPFHPDFSFGSEITAFLTEAGVSLRPVSIHIEGEGQVFRPHRDQVDPAGKTVTMRELEKFVTLDRDGQVAAASWILHHDYIGSLPKNTLINGWRLRSGDLQVGESSLLEELFPEQRFNGWTIAETHVLDRKIVPNGRRDSFEHSARFVDLQTRLMPHARDIAQRCRTSSLARTTTQRLDAELNRLEDKLTIAGKPRTPTFVITSIRNEIAAALPSLQKATEKTLFDNSNGEKLRTRVRKLANKAELLAESPSESDGLLDFPPSQRAIVKQVIEAIHVIEGESENADKLIGKILARLRRQRGASSKR